MKPPGAGRAPGQANHRTLECKTIFEAATKMMGGAKGLMEWAQRNNENETIFWSIMFMKLIPVQVQGEIQTTNELVVSVTKDDLAKKLEEHGLPPLMYERDVPLLEGEVVDDQKSCKQSG